MIREELQHPDLVKELLAELAQMTGRTGDKFEADQEKVKLFAEASRRSRERFMAQLNQD